MKYGADLSDGKRSFMLSCTPGHIISTAYEDFSVEEYNIDRTTRQMGMDQCVPTFRRRRPSVEQLKTCLDHTRDEGSSYWFPCIDRTTYVTPGYMEFWDQQLERLNDYVTASQPLVKDPPSSEMSASRPKTQEYLWW